MSIPQADIDHILRMEGNADYARMKIATEFSKGKSVEEIAAFLQSSFHGGNGVVTENGRYSAWYADDGIHIANGDAARYLTSAKVVSWQEAAERIGQLLTQGEYANKSDWRHPFRISSNDLYCSQVNGRCCPQQERRISYYGGRTPS